MEAKTYSFSAKSSSDRQLIEGIKTNASRTGTSFSFIVIQALKQYQERINEQKA